LTKSLIISFQCNIESVHFFYSNHVCYSGVMSVSFTVLSSLLWTPIRHTLSSAGDRNATCRQRLSCRLRDHCATSTPISLTLNVLRTHWPNEDKFSSEIHYYYGVLWYSPRFQQACHRVTNFVEIRHAYGALSLQVVRQHRRSAHAHHMVKYVVGWSRLSRETHWPYC
jgi:hypothetical protein